MYTGSLCAVVFHRLVYFLEFGIALTLFFSGLYAVANRLDLQRNVIHLLVVAMLLRVGTAGVVDTLGTVFGQVDSGRFDRALWQTAEGLRSGVVTAPYETATSIGDLFYIPYTAVYAPVYAVFGHHTLLVRTAFAFVGTLVVLNVFRIGKALYGQNAGLCAGCLAAVFPYWLYLSTIFYRDMLIMLVSSQMLYMMVRWEQDRTLAGVAGVAALAFVSLLLRPENVLPVGVAAGFSCYALFRDFGFVTKLTVLATIAVGTFRGLQSVGVNGTSIVARQLSKERAQLAEGGGAYLGNVVFEGVWSLVAFAPVGAVYFLLVPFPWQVHNILALVALLQNLVVWYPVVVLSVAGLGYAASRRPIPTLVLAGFAISGIAGYGLIEANMGPALRHRAQFQFVVFVFAALPLAERIQFALPTDRPAGEVGS